MTCFVRALEISSVLLLPQKFLLAAKALHPSVDHEIFEQFNLRDLSGHMCLNPFYYSQVAKQGVVYGCCAVSFTHGEFVLDSGPDVICFSQDPSCNLRCPQCRSDFKNHNRDEEQQRRLDPIADVFKDALESARTRKLSVELSADGDPFYSRHYRKLLALIDPDEHPHLNLILTTNGQLLEKSWPEFPQIHGLVERLCISLDAASDHPEHSAFPEQLRSPVFDDPIIDLGNLETIRAHLGGV